MAEQQKLIEKYAIQSLEELKLPTRISKVLYAIRETTGFRLMLYGTPGTGKTTTAKLMTKGHDVLYLSGSNEFNIETMRTKVYPFCGSFSISGKQKTLIIDEAENIKNNIQDAFKIIFDASKNVNFIFITNEIGKMNDAVLSRCTNIEYNFYDSEIQEQKINYVTFLKKVCDEEKIAYDKEGLSYLYKTKFPDFRALLVALQYIVDGGQSLTVAAIKAITESIGKSNPELYAFIEDVTNTNVFFTKMSAFRGKEKECFFSLGEPFYEYLNNKGKFDLTLKAAVIVEKHSNNFVVSMNKFNTFFACCSELKTLFR